MTLHIRNNRVYKFVLLTTLAVSLGLLWQINQKVLSNPTYIPVDDFSHYWAAGRLAIQGENPYDPELIQSLRNLITGNSTKYAEVPIAWTPPWSLSLLMPFGIFPYPLARLIWLLAAVGIVMVCSEKIWQIYHADRKYLPFAWLMAFSFGPTISVLEKGQITPWILAGITGFIYFTSVKSNDWIAGFFTSLISLKPQLFYLFWPAIIFWIFISRRWIIGLSSVITLAIFSLPGLILNPGLITQYVQAILNNTPSGWATPTIGGYLRLWLGIEKFYLQFIPVLFGLVWFTWYWLKNKQTWSWTKALPNLLFASILTTAYAWTYDQVILLPAILVVLSQVVNHKRKNITWIFAGLLMIVNLLDLLLHRNLDEFWFGWLAPAYLLCFIAGKWISNQLSTTSKATEPMLQEHTG